MTVTVIGKLDILQKAPFLMSSKPSLAIPLSPTWTTVVSIGACKDQKLCWKGLQLIIIAPQVSILHKDSTSYGMHSSPLDRLNIFPVGGPFWESYSKALQGASKTSLIRMIQKNYRDKAHLANWWHLTKQPMQFLKPVKWRAPWDNEDIITYLLKSFIYGGFWGGADGEWGWHL